MAREAALPVHHPTDRLVGQTPAIQALRAQIHHLAAFDAVGNPYAPTVLMQGETGTGKGLVARIIHDSGPRGPGPFLDVNCAAIPETLLEAELFGFEAGAFTDAKRAKPGLFEAASGGTLFLDEIEALPLALQSKLLTAIEAKRIRRLGAVAERAVDAKLIAATQTDLSVSVSAGRFRADLYHRLAVVVLTLPPLRERGDDILDLTRHFLRHYGEVHGLRPKGLSRAAEAWLRRYDWPGNVRELSHLMERLTLLSPETQVAPESLERIFDKFVRERGDTVSGTGLGLYISRQILYAHGGQIWRYTPGRDRLELVVLFAPADDFAGPDNITVSPYGYAVMCTDSDDDAQFVAGITENGETFPLAYNRASDSEFAGACFSPDEEVSPLGDVAAAYERLMKNFAVELGAQQQSDATAGR